MLITLPQNSCGIYVDSHQFVREILAMDVYADPNRGTFRAAIERPLLAESGRSGQHSKLLRRKSLRLSPTSATDPLQTFTRLIHSCAIRRCRRQLSLRTQKNSMQRGRDELRLGHRHIRM